MKATVPNFARKGPSARFLKQATGGSPATEIWAPGGDGDERVVSTVRSLLKRIEEGGEKAVLEIAGELDGYTGDTIVVSKEEVEAVIANLPQSLKEDVQFQHARVTNFAREQLKSLHEFECELYPGVTTGQKIIPCETAGCYIPGGRFSHVSSAIMSVATAKVAGVKNVVAASPPLKGNGKIHPGTLYAMHLAGADVILCVGGVQAIGAMGYGCFSGQPADIIVGPGNAYVAEAKRMLFGMTGIDMFAGPTETMVLADETCDVAIAAMDLIGQAEHGPTSPAWMITTSEEVARKLIDVEIPRILSEMPEDTAAHASWRDYGEVVVVDTREEVAALSDHYASEHLQVQAKDLDWWLSTLTNYGSLFLGEETQTTFGDKCSGTNHILPTKRVSRYSGGLSVDKFVKKVTYQKMTREANRDIAFRASRISRLEGMEGHARSCDVRLAKYFPDEKFDLAIEPY